MRKAIIVAGLLFLLSSGSVWASGLAIPEQGTAALGLSAAMTARNEDLSAIYYNPAALDYVQGFEIYAGITPIAPGHSFAPFREDRDYFDETDAESNIYLPPQLYAAWRASSHVVLGVGVYAPFGLGTEWEDDWAGRYTSTFAEITTIYINPTIAINVTDKVSLGLGASYITSDATIEKMVDTGAKLVMGTDPMYDSKFGLEGDGDAFSVNAGVLYKPASTVQLGVSYRSAYEIEYEGDAKFKHQALFQGIPYPLNTAISMSDVLYSQMPETQSGTATLRMPWQLNFGAFFRLTEKLNTSADLDFVGWDRYEDLTIDFDDDLPSDKSTQDKDWENSWILRGGASYDYTEKLVLRGGLMYDSNPVPDETMDGQLPDSDRVGISAGVGYKMGRVRLDAAYMLLAFRDRDKDNGVGFSTDTTGDGTIDRFDVPNGYPTGNGKYSSRAHLFSVAMSIAF